MKKTVKTIATTFVTALFCFWQGASFAAAAPVPVTTAQDTVAIADCNWNHPGANPFMGDVVAAVDRYQDMAPAVRARLQARMAKRDYDEVVEIRRDRISGRNDYGSDIADMHFGTRQLCHRVTRSAWTPQMQERGLVYCEGSECILVPTVCRNVSRIQRRAVQSAAMQSALAPALAAFAPAAGADKGGPERAGPLGWAPGGMFAGSPASGLAGAAGAVFAGGTGAGAGQAGGGGAGPSGNGGPTLHPTETVAYARQSARVVGDDTDRPFQVTPESPVIAAPVPEPETWMLMTVGLLGAGLTVFGRRRSARATTSTSTATDAST